MDFTAAPRSTTTKDFSKPALDLTHTLFEVWVDRSPDSLAVTGEEGPWTYAQLELRANRIAHMLHAAGAQPGTVVAVCLERGPELICALLGVLKSGAAFAAFDPHAPRESLARLLSTVDCPLVLTRSSLASNLPAASARLFLLDDGESLCGQPTSRLAPLAGPHDPACVLFTSGSNAHPKAVLYRHRSLAKRFSNTAQISGFGPGCVFAQSSPITSIDAVDEIFLPLVTGGGTAVLPYTTVTQPHHLIDSLSFYRVTHILLVPSLLRVILSETEDLTQTLGALQTWIIGGELLTPALAEEFHKRLSQAVLINFYGLTEGDATYHILSRTEHHRTSVPIGRPVRGTEVYLLDEQLRRVPVGKMGEIYLAGDALFHEYVNCPELNATRWIPNPFSADGTHARLFRTGDLGRLRSDGELEYLGRADRMVKVRGFRVELGEVEGMLSQHAAVDQCIVVARQRPVHDGISSRHATYLVAYAVLKRDAIVAARDLRAYLRNRLPDFAVPSIVLLLDALPLSPNGKVDIPALPEPSSAHDLSDKVHVPGRNAMEVQLIRIWEDLLKLRPIGVTDNFFEIGGDSLAAIDLMLAIEKEFHCRLPITALLQSPTVAALAGLLHARNQEDSPACLVPIRAEGSRPPLFCVHADGSVFIYRRFANYLDVRIPIYGLQAHGLANPKHRPYEHVDEMAAHYIREMRTVQPHGPYRLCAFSAGGLIIFEMARQLHALGEEVGFLGMLDAYGPAYPQYVSVKNRADYKISVHLNTLRLHGVQGQVKYLWGRARHRCALTLSRVFAGLLPKMHLPLPGRVRYEYFAWLIDQAAQNYPPGRSYPGEVTLFQASSQPNGAKPDPTLGWGGLVTGPIQVVDVTGTHNSIMMHEPHVAELVRKIDNHLNQLHDSLPSGTRSRDS